MDAAPSAISAPRADVPGTGWAHLRVHVPGDQCDCFPRDQLSGAEDSAKSSLAPVAHPNLSSAAGLVLQLQREFDSSGTIINEYALVPPEVIGGASFVRPEAGKLAISSSLAKPLFKEASLLLKPWLKAGSEGTARSRSRDAQALAWAATRALLLVSGDHYTAWNARKRLVAAAGAGAAGHRQAAQLLALLEAELHLTTLVFSVRPKASSAWAHRKWACRLAADAFATMAAAEALEALHAAAAEATAIAGPDAEASPAVADAGVLATSPAAFWGREVDVCEALAQKHPKNYFAWTHRLAVCRAHFAGAVLNAEAARAAAFLARSPSDRAASHHCEQLLVLQLAATAHAAPLGEGAGLRADVHQRAVAGALLATAAARGQRRCASQPGHEALWQHLRALAKLRLAHAATPLSSHVDSGASAASHSASDALLEAACAALRGGAIERPPTADEERTGVGQRGSSGDAVAVSAGCDAIPFPIT